MRHNNSDNFNQPIATKPIQSLLDIPIELIAKKAGDDFNQRIYKKDIFK